MNTLLVIWSQLGRLFPPISYAVNGFRVKIQQFVKIKTKYARRHKLKAGNYSTQLGKGLETSHFHILHMTPVHFDVGFFSYFSALIGHTEENERILQYISLSFTVDSAKHPANKR